MEKSLLFFIGVFFSFNSPIVAQDFPKILMKHKWSSYDNFAVMDFQKDQKVIIEYAYCTYCRHNMETLEWKYENNILVIGKDSLFIQSVENSSIRMQQNGQEFMLKKLEKVKPSKINREAVQKFLVSEKPLRLINKKMVDSIPKSIQFNANGKMWLEMPKYRGQWALKSFYGQLFLIYINRHAIDRNFPLLKIKKFKKGKLTGQPIPSITNGQPFELEIYR